MFKTNNKDGQNLTEQLICVNKVSKTIKGGKTFSFAALVVVGDKKGRVGYGKGKAKEVSNARTKAYEVAKKSMIKVSLKEGRTTHHDCEGRFGSGKVLLRTAPPGTGVISGGPLRAVFDCLGIKDIVAKSIGSSNSYNMVAATFEALNNISSPKSTAERRKKHISEIIKRRNVALGIITNTEE